MLLDGVNDSTSSGRGDTVTGGGSYTWSVTWDEGGFTGIGWRVSEFADYSNSTDDEIRADAAQIAFSLAGRMHPCASFLPVSF